MPGDQDIIETLVNKLARWWNRDAKKFAIYKFEDVNHVKGVNDYADPLTAEVNYFRIWLCEMYLAKDRQWFKSWYPTVHSLISLQFGGKNVEIPYIAGPLNLTNIKQSNLDKVITLNQNLTTFVPFNGGTIGLTAALLAMQGVDKLDQFIQVLGDFSNVLVLPQLSAALNVIKPIESGINTLLGIDNGEIALGIRDTYTGKGGVNELKAIYIAPILCEEKDLPKDKLWIKDSRLYHGNSLSDCEPLKGYDYMLLRIEITNTRDDLASITSINDPWMEAINCALMGDKVKGDLKFKQTIEATLNCPDLTKADRNRLINQYKSEYKKAVESSVLEVEIGEEIFSLDNMINRAISPQAALELGDLNFDQILQSISNE